MNAAQRHSIVYRPILPSDLEVLEQIHAALFPIRYEREFFLNVVRGHGIVSWAAVDIGTDSQSNDLVGFVTTRIIAVTESEIDDLIQCDSSRKDQTLVYILTLGVIEHYRNHGIAGSLVREVVKYASNIASCRAVYLHVIDYNLPAISFYKKMLFKLSRKLPKFYYIKGHHYDAYLFVYYVNSGRSPCSPLDVVAMVSTYVIRLFRMLAAKLWSSGGKKDPRRLKRDESISLLDSRNRKTGGAIPDDDCLCEFV